MFNKFYLCENLFEPSKTSMFFYIKKMCRHISRSSHPSTNQHREKYTQKTIAHLRCMQICMAHLMIIKVSYGPCSLHENLHTREVCNILLHVLLSSSFIWRKIAPQWSVRHLNKYLKFLLDKRTQSCLSCTFNAGFPVLTKMIIPL